MALVEMIMPQMGESIMEGTILKWLKEVGETIEEEEPVLEVATDKVDNEIPATHAGVLKEILAQEGDVVEVGKPVCIIETDGEDLGSTLPITETKVESPANEIEQSITQIQESVSSSNGQNTHQLNEPIKGRFYSPLVLSIAKKEGIAMEELELIPGTGQDNRVTKKDMFAYVEMRQAGQTITATIPQPEIKTQPKKQQAPIKPEPVPVTPSTSLNGNVEIVEMDRMRKMIAQRMVESKQISPHVTTFIEADVTNMVNWRNKIKGEFKKREGENFTFTPILIEAIAKALQEFPMVNVSVDGDKILVKKDINVGMATALANNNLIVPVIKNANHLSLTGLAKKVNDLASRARTNKLSADELSGGTYSMSNIGGFGNEMGTPIIMQPQVAIMAFGAIKKKPAVIETPEGDFIGIRHMMFLSHSYDHRVVDGALGGRFVRRVADLLENFDITREV